MTSTLKILTLVAAGLLLIVCICIGLMAVISSGVFRRDEFSDQHATVGVILDSPLAAIPAICSPGSNSHYIRVGGKTYTYHSGSNPGYFIVPEINSMIFQTTQDRHGGLVTIHIRDLKTGVVTDIDARGLDPWVVTQASYKNSPHHWWVHNCSASQITFGLYAFWAAGTPFPDSTGSAHLEFTTINFKSRQVVKMLEYSYDGDGNLAQDDGTYQPPPPGLSAAELIGEHRDKAGLPPLPPSPAPPL